MQSILDDHPADKHGRRFYSLPDTQMDEQGIRERFHDDQTYFDVPEETV